MAAPAAVRASTRRRALLAAVVALASVAGCVDVVTDGGDYGAYSADLDGEVVRSFPEGLGVPVAIAIPDTGVRADPLLLEFYSVVLQRFEAAAQDGNVALLDALVATYDKPAAPPGIREQLRGYRGVARGIAFQQHLRRTAELRLRDLDEVPALGAPLALELSVPAMAEPVTLFATDEQSSFAFWLAIAIEDEFADGSTSSSRQRQFVGLPRTLTLAGGAALELPMDVVIPAGRAVRRTIQIRVDAMPGYVQVGDVRAPLKLRTITGQVWTQWLDGAEALRGRPLEGLQKALAEVGSKSSFAAIAVASYFVQGDDVEPACELLIDQVRHGSDRAARVAMAALRRITGVGRVVGDRDGWLAWWQERAR